MGKRMKRKQYEENLRALQEALLALQLGIQARGGRLLVLFEGRDAAGKGGVIHAIAERLNPRHCRVVALGKPDERERGQWYFQRYVAHLPTAGEIVLFDRSWYNRAGVERVMGFCTPEEYRRFLRQAPRFERMLAEDGILILKYWLAVSQEEQERRFAERAADPLKRHKLSPIDLAARERYEEYTRLREAMFRATHRPWAPWFLVDFEDQRRGRLNLIQHLLERVPIRAEPGPPIRLPPLPGAPRAERRSARVEWVGEAA